MSRKRFLTMVTAIVIMAAMGLMVLYLTLGRMSAMLRARDHAPGSTQQIRP